MAVLELSLLPLDPPLMHYASYFAWLIAFFVATIATFSRLSLLSSGMEHGPFHMFISTKLHYHQLYTLRKASSSQAKQTIASYQGDSQCVDHEEEQEVEEEKEAQQKEAEKKPWHQTPEIFSSGGGEDDQEEDDEEQEQGIPPDWMFSLLEAFTAYPKACLSRRKVLKPSFTSWSQDLNRRISMHAGRDWQVSMCQHLMQRSCKKEEVLHSSGTQCSAADAAGIGYCNGGGCIGDEDKVVALWDVKKSLCLHALPYTQSMPLSWSFSGTTIAGGPYSPGVKTSVVSLWDDRCPPLQSASRVVVQATSPQPAVKGCQNQLAIAGKGVISLHDFRMLSGRPVALYVAALQWTGDQRSGQARAQRSRHLYHSSDIEELERHTPGVEEPEGVCRREMDKPSLSSTNYYEPLHHNTKTSRKASFLISCLSIMFCLPKHEE